MGRVWLAGLLGGIALFAWGLLAHVWLGIGTLSGPPLDKEPALFAAMQHALPESGIYMLPGLEGAPRSTDKQMEAFLAKAKLGPRGFLVFHADGADMDAAMPKQIFAQFAACVAGGLIAAFLLASAGGLSGYFARVYFCALLGLAAWLTTDASYWIWYGFPFKYELGQLIEHVVGYTCAGLVIAKVLPKRT